MTMLSLAVRPSINLRQAAVVMAGEIEQPQREPARNVIGTSLRCCCSDVHGSGIGTGFYRDGFCSTGPADEGRHTVCIEATESFLAVSAAVGNPLHQAIPQYMFPGVRPGDCWCLCASRYAQLLKLEVKDAQGNLIKGFVPRIHLHATHEKTLDYVPLETLMFYAIDADEARKEMSRIDKLRSELEKNMKL
eukprot:CAMPEP_0119310244 /NCGR_PEP_ID=MMETSP1333-20130426/18379_1 /TAXON_ID=418940 /ORGANISM="Scyphosphaera apsteinii, Strain RCC1455" /LENGTH=190 /DNA_ID=CAMNT_0007314395 /DNA_START=101 /DNA_END=673 /DNA_ORIENTATION=+